MKIYRVVMEVETPDDWNSDSVKGVFFAPHVKVLSAQKLKKGSHQVIA